jgi:chloramphenicol 3-O-phosphotransferase
MKIKPFDSEMVSIWRRKSVLEMPAVVQEMQKFWAKEELQTQDVHQMREILRDAANLLDQMEYFVSGYEVSDEEVKR